jgi:outer membrane protein assembly factor BamE (lipoprotein component of BamABCDE complex)
MQQGIVVILALIIVIGAMVGCSDWAGTIYAPAYKEADFRKVHVGMDLSEVLSLLGDPLEI